MPRDLEKFRGDGAVGGGEQYGDINPDQRPAHLDEFHQAVTVKAELLAMLNGHVADCPMKSRIDIVEDYIIAQKTKAVDGKNWMDRLWPLIWSALGVVAYLVGSPCMLRKC
jgi:hypothetical protein